MEEPMNSNIPLIQAGRVLPGNLVGSVLVASDPRAWPDLVLEEHSYKTFEPADMSYNQHVIAVNIGASITCEYRRGSTGTMFESIRERSPSFRADTPFIDA
jgi:hypothetical protein